MSSKKLNQQRMIDAKAWLEDRDIGFECPTAFQLKIGEINYYPGQGTIYLDGEECALQDRGLSALEKVLHERGHVTALSNITHFKPIMGQKSRYPGS